jgi:hypothetical protein
MLAITLTLALFTQHRSAWAGGTHFVVQLHGGFAFPPTGGSDLSLGWGFLAGYGGRLGGTHLRFYGLVGFDRASFAEEGVVPETGHPWSSQRSYNDLQAGLRMLLPIWWRLRWYVDLFVGASYLQGELMWTSTFPFDTSDWSGLLTGATGLEVRWHRHFATGIRGEIRWLMTESDVIPQIVGQEEASPLRFTVMATQAFLF